MNDDNADAKLWTYNEPNNAYTYDVKFIGPLCNPEGSFIKYGIRLDTEPTHLVYISPEIILVNKSDIKLPPKIVLNKQIAIFSPSNTNIH